MGDWFTDEIAQADTQVLKVTPTRFQIEYEMPNRGTTRGWKKGLVICGKLYYWPQTRQERLDHYSR